MADFPIRLASGSVSFTGVRTTDTATFRFVPPAGFIQGVAVAELAGVRIQLLLTQPGNFTLSGLKNRQYSVYVISYAPGLSGAEEAAPSNVLTYTHTTEPVGVQERMNIDWRTDYHQEWMGGEWREDVTRARLVPNATAHWLQFRVRGCGQNQRVTLRNIQVEAAIHSLAESAEES